MKSNNDLKIPYILLFSMLALLNFSSCKDDEPVDPNQTDTVTYVTTVDVDSTDISIGLEAKDGPIHTGYNDLVLHFFNTETKEAISTREIMIKPMMKMTEMTHSSPIEEHNRSADAGSLAFNPVFIMPSTEMGTWTLKIAFEDQEGHSYNVVIPIDVVENSPPLLKRTLDTNSVPYFISILNTDEFKVGQNEIEFTIHRRQDMMNFPAEEVMSLSIKPWMPTMGHGSPNNVNPVHVENGHYRGTVNFTMTGLWEIEVLLTKEGTEFSAPVVFEHTL